jgi:hypothetical protein
MMNWKETEEKQQPDLPLQPRKNICCQPAPSEDNIYLLKNKVEIQKHEWGGI